jgi:hypothetical protein
MNHKHLADGPRHALIDNLPLLGGGSSSCSSWR